VKSAQERAKEIVRLADSYEGNNLTDEELAERIAESFVEFAQEQTTTLVSAGQCLYDTVLRWKWNENTSNQLKAWREARGEGGT
jgi:hypothetical protein